MIPQNWQSMLDMARQSQPPAANPLMKTFGDVSAPVVGMALQSIDGGWGGSGQNGWGGNYQNAVNAAATPLGMVDGKVFYSNPGSQIFSGNNRRESEIYQGWANPDWITQNTNAYTDPTSGQSGFLIDKSLLNDPNFAVTKTGDYRDNSNKNGSAWTQIRDLGEAAGTMVGNYFLPGSSMLTSKLVSNGAQQQLSTPLGRIGTFASGAAGGINGNMANYGKVADFGSNAWNGGVTNIADNPAIQTIDLTGTGESAIGPAGTIQGPPTGWMTDPSNVGSPAWYNPTTGALGPLNGTNTLTQNLNSSSTSEALKKLGNDGLQKALSSLLGGNQQQATGAPGSGGLLSASGVAPRNAPQLGLLNLTQPAYQNIFGLPEQKPYRSNQNGLV